MIDRGLSVGEGVAMGGPHVVAVLNIPQLKRDHANAVLSCRASNNNISAAISKSIQLKLNRK